MVLQSISFNKQSIAAVGRLDPTGTKCREDWRWILASIVNTRYVRICASMSYVNMLMVCGVVYATIFFQKDRIVGYVTLARVQIGS
jgi:hypothetical protein